jgi:hypothetical protein
MARELLKIATDENAPEAVRVNAIKDALDRAGVQARTAVDVSVTAKPYESIFEAMETGSRADYRRSIGIEDEPEVLTSTQTPALAAQSTDDADALDVEIVDDDAGPLTPDEPERGSAFDSAAQPSPFASTSPFAPATPPGTALMPYDAAVSAAAAMRRSAVSHRAQRR